MFLHESDSSSIRLATVSFRLPEFFVESLPSGSDTSLIEFKLLLLKILPLPISLPYYVRKLFSKILILDSSIFSNLLLSLSFSSISRSTGVLLGELNSFWIFSFSSWIISGETLSLGPFYILLFNFIISPNAECLRFIRCLIILSSARSTSCPMSRSSSGFL